MEKHLSKSEARAWQRAGEEAGQETAALRAQLENPALTRAHELAAQISRDQWDKRRRRSSAEIAVEIEVARSRLATRNREVEVARCLPDARAAREEELAAVQAATTVRTASRARGNPPQA